MKLTRSVGYAIGVLLRVSDENSSGPVPLKTIAEGCDLPPRFIYRILRRLVSAGLLVGISGPGGGYRLGRKANQINLFDVLLAVEGPLPQPELEAIHPTQANAFALINEACQQSLERFEANLSKLTLARLARQ